MRVAHFISVMAEADGHSLFCRRLCEELAGLGHICAICCGDEPGLRHMSMAASVFVRQFPTRSRLFQMFGGATQRETERFLTNLQPDVVHIHGLWHPLVHAASVRARYYRIPCMTSLHGMARPLALRIGRMRKRIAWQMYQRRDLRASAVLHAMTAQEADDPLCCGVGVPVSIVPMGVDVPDGERTRVTGRRKQALYLGRINRGKGLADLVDAWTQIRPSGWQLALAGPDECGHTAALRRRIQAQGIVDDVVWPGPVYGDDKDRLFASTDLLVLPSPSESFGAVVGEALARGIPAITTQGAPWETLLSACCGWWVASGVAPLAGALAEATALSDEQRAAMGRRGRQLVADRYAWKNVAEQMLAIYEQIGA